MLIYSWTDKRRQQPIPYQQAQVAVEADKVERMEAEAEDQVAVAVELVVLAALFLYLPKSSSIQERYEQ